jgi:predicted DNA binding protein
MEYVELKIRPGDRWFHEFDELIAADPKLSHGPIHHVNLLSDDTMVVLYEIYGPKERVEELHGKHNHVAESAHLGDDTLVYSHHEPSDVAHDLLSVANEHSVVVDTPIKFSDDDELQVRLIGTSKALQAAFGSAPDDAQVTVEKTGEYRPGTERLFTDLTDRQRETLLTALETGYYDNPRRSTYSDIASELDCTATTVGEHLRKIEGYVLREIAPRHWDRSR